ncbi:MAG: hypothetical protein J5I90_05665, partial [Caldilineales bacterium]|nr:hypothetical protein [Caldilineales bacterium]
ESKRPSLIVRYELQPRVGTPTPTPSPTATPTATLTPSPTPTATPMAATLRGVIYVDENGDGERQAGELPLAGAIVNLSAAQNQWADETGADGLYEFVSLSPGQYTLEVSPPAGYGPSRPQTPLNFAINPGVDMELNFGHEPLPTPTVTPTASPTALELYLPLLRR